MKSETKTKKEKKALSSEDEDYDSCSDNGSFDSVRNGRRRQKQFSVLRSDSDGLRMKISAIRNKKEKPATAEVKSNNNNHTEGASKRQTSSQSTIKRKLSSSSCCCTRSDESDSSSEGQKKEKLKKIRLKRKKNYTSSANLSTDSGSDNEHALQSTATITKPQKDIKQLPAQSQNVENLPGSSISSSDNELPALVSAAIKCVESGSETEPVPVPAAAAPPHQYTSTLLHDFMLKTQMIGGICPETENETTKETESGNEARRGNADTTKPTDLSVKKEVQVKKKRGRPKKKPVVEAEEVVPNGHLEQKELQPHLPKINVISLEKQMYATERVLYPPRSKKKATPRTNYRMKLTKEDVIDPLWRKIDVNTKFRRPSLTGYKSDGGNTVCSKILAAKSGYVSDYGSVGHRHLSGYKSDASGKSRYSMRSCISRAKSCDFRCGGSRMRKLRRKRRFLDKSRQKFGNVNEQDILQLAGLSLGQSNEESSRESLNKPIISYGQSKKYGEINRFIRTGEYFGRNKKNHHSRDFADVCAGLGDGLFAKSSSFSSKGYKSQSTSKILEFPNDFEGLRSKIRSRRSSAVSRCSSMSMCSRYDSRRRKRRKFRLKSQSRSGFVDSKLNTEIEILINTFPSLCRIATDKLSMLRDKDRLDKDKSNQLGQKLASKRNQKKRKLSESADHHLTERFPNEIGLMPKRRHKKAGNNCQDEHKLPLKKRHYLLTPGEKATKNTTETPAPVYPPPGIFEPSVELEIQITLPKEAMAIVTKSEIDSPKNLLDPAEVEKFLPSQPKTEKMVETLLNRTGGNSLLLKRKRRKAFNRTGFPKTKQKRRKVSSASETDVKPAAPPVPRFTKLSNTAPTSSKSVEPVVLRASSKEVKSNRDAKDQQKDVKDAKDTKLVKDTKESKENCEPQKDVKPVKSIKVVKDRPKKETPVQSSSPTKPAKNKPPVITTIPRTRSKSISTLPSNAQALLPTTKVLNVRLRRTKTFQGKVIDSEITRISQRIKSIKKEPHVTECSITDDLEQEPLPLLEAVPTTTQETSDSSSTSSKIRKIAKWRKAYLPAGLLSNYFKTEKTKKGSDRNVEKSESSDDSENSPKSILPPPPYCEKFFRRTVYDFLLPYDLWWAHTNSKLLPRNTVPSWNYKKIRSNIYGDTRYNPSIDNQICNCKPTTACGDDCLNRMVYTECSPSNCPCGDKCQNQKIQKHEVAPGTERFMTANKGWGVRTNLPIKKGMYIMEYVGEVVPEREFKERMATLYVNDTHHYCLHLDGGFVIDGHRMGSDARFVNHSCSPNCEMQKWSVNGLFRMALFAMRDITPGEELTYDYNFSLFNPAEGQPCRCDTPQCRGVIGGKSQRVKPLEVKPVESAPPNRHGRPRKRTAKKNSGRIQSKDAVIPQFQILSDREKKLIRSTHCFLMRNLEKVRRVKTKMTQAITKMEETPSRPITPSSLVVQISALRSQRNIKTRGLTQAAHDPEVEKMAKIAVILQAICADIEGVKDSSGRSQLSKLVRPKRKKRTSQDKERFMDITTIRSNIEKGLYKDVEAFDADMNKIFDSAETFFESQSEELAAIQNLRTAYMSIKSKFYDQLAEHVDERSLMRFRRKEDNLQQPEVKTTEDIIRCICGLFKDEGLMIQCSKCFVWQHTECTKANPKAESYLCEKCDNRVVDYEIPLNDYSDEGHQYYLSLMRGDLQVRQGDTVYVLRDIPMKDENGKILPSRKHTYETIGKIDFSECDIFRVEKLWKNSEGKRLIYGHHYLRPHETFHEPSRRFYENEVIRVPYYEVVPIELVMARCWVFDRNTFCKGRPVDCNAEEHVYICELRVDKSARFFARAKQSFTTCTKNYAFRKFKEKLKVFKTYAPHEVDPNFLKTKKRKNEVEPEKKPICPIIQLVPPPPKTLHEKRSRLEDVLGNLKTRTTPNSCTPPVDLSYLLTGRGARHRRAAAAAAVVPIK